MRSLRILNCLFLRFEEAARLHIHTSPLELHTGHPIKDGSP
jgi:hypothetical protein